MSQILLKFFCDLAKIFILIVLCFKLNISYNVLEIYIKLLAVSTEWPEKRAQFIYIYLYIVKVYRVCTNKFSQLFIFSS